MIDFLIVEDDDNKYQDVCALVTSVRAGFYIERADNVKDAISLIKKRKFSFVVVDIQLPNDKANLDKNSNAGLELIRWIKHNQRKKKCLPPDNILILSKYQDLIDKHYQDFNETRVFSYLYGKEIDDWKNQIKNCIEEHLIKIEDNIDKSDEEVILYSVHGINTNGEWQEDLDSFISCQNKVNNISHQAYKYQYYPIYSFLIPPLRTKEVKRLITDLEFCARRAPNATVHLIGHSFGTYVICKALEKLPFEKSPKIGNIILVNSVLKSGYDFSKVVRKHRIKKIVCECALNDRVLILSQALAFGLGMAGRVGFKGRLYKTILNRYFKGGHSDLFHSSSYTDWLSVINGLPIEEVDHRGKITATTAVKNSLLICSPYVLFAGIVFALWTQFS
ncbi:alpha/beta hydrolase [Vibrio harveyi]|uniref:alpha/beta hydrolase n=1 Tax=Vibrio harveyi TaxID=669 RepID=UPI0024805C26|nr:alpha/beta hydrolase [Vibrio harveyi]